VRGDGARTGADDGAGGRPKRIRPPRPHARARARMREKAPGRVDLGRRGGRVRSQRLSSGDLAVLAGGPARLILLRLRQSAQAGSQGARSRRRSREDAFDVA
jgi:hypothetical protein